MRILVWTDLGTDERQAALARPAQRADPSLTSDVRAIIEKVRAGGWEALCEIAGEIDGGEPVQIATAPLAEWARHRFEPDQVEAMELAASNIRAFHQASLPADLSVETMPGLRVRRLWRPIERVGLYVPGGNTPLFSTLLMLALPAQVAGVREIVAVTPPRFDGGIDPAMALAAELSGIDAIWTVGGAQAIAALAFGAGSIGRVDKICGPGNSWVTEAKRLVSSVPGGPAIDMPAGPSELMIIADAKADAQLIAADLLSQAEHDPAAQVLVVTPSTRLASEIIEALEDQIVSLPRSQIAKASLKSARLILVPDLADAIEIANCYAPEHLSLAVKDPEALLPELRNAGAIFAGPLYAETFGDYLAGSSHVLPTDGAARAWGGLSVLSFLKAMSVQTVTLEAACQIAAPAALLARMEALEGHARAAEARLEYLV